MATCPDCNGEGGWPYWENTDEDGFPGREAVECWEECPWCHGSGYVEGEPEPLSIDDLDMRAPIDCLLEAWAKLAAQSIKPGVRRRIAGHCDRRLSWQYRVSEC